MTTTIDQHAVAAHLRKLADIIEAGPPTRRGALQVQYPDGDRDGVDQLTHALGMDPAEQYEDSRGNGRIGYQSGGLYGSPVSVIVACTLHRDSATERRRKLAAELAAIDAQIAANGHAEVSDAP